MTPTHATLAILFVDVSGSTRLYETIGDERALARVGRSLTMIARVSEDCGGRVVKTMGDGAMCVFETADAAMRASRLMLEKNDEQQDPGEPGLGIHVGCHYGPVLESAGDVFGDTVNLAARVAGLAKVGQIITTADTAAKLSPELAARARKLHAMPVKGKQEPVVICELLWQDVGDLTVYGTSPDHARLARLLLRYDGREWRFDGPGELHFGRDGGCDVVVADSKASRKHALIERRRNKFVLVDQSSNGTWVRFTGETEGVVLHREELMLRASGVICFGHVLAEGEGAPVEFSCE
jgi:class 3 adenylate cyclase